MLMTAFSLADTVKEKQIYEKMKNYDRVHKGLIIYGKESIIFGNEGELL